MLKRWLKDSLKNQQASSQSCPFEMLAAAVLGGEIPEKVDGLSLVPPGGTVKADVPVDVRVQAGRLVLISYHIDDPALAEV
jgi:hypothetical protein